jgi:biopolymer transport protein ExbD
MTPAPPRQSELVIEHVRVRQRRGRASASLALNMTSIIDVVFLLLIYFLVATDFRLGEEVYRMDLPAREGVSQRDPFELDDEPLRIAVMSTGLAPERSTRWEHAIEAFNTAARARYTNVTLAKPGA